jgi:hypothetical protein
MQEFENTAIARKLIPLFGETVTLAFSLHKCDILF